MSTKPIQIAFRPPYWSDEELECLAYKDPSSHFLRTHPGLEIHERLESLSSILRLFNKTALSIQRTIDLFHNEAHHKNLLRLSRRSERQRLEEEIQEALYLFAACSMTIVDQSRALTDKIHIPGYQERINQHFLNNPQHRFVQELRVDLVHIALHEPNWMLTTEKSGQQTTRFLIKPFQLKRLNEYHRSAKKYVSQNHDGIDIGQLVSNYSLDVNTQHLWLHNETERVAGDLVGDYRRSRRVVHAVHFRSIWRFILSQAVIQAKRDPFSYLDLYLTPDELTEVLALPTRSKLQVDRIIQFIDAENACSLDLRELAYKAFGVDGP